MEIKATLNKPYTDEQRMNFIVDNNHKLGYEIRETEVALEAWGETDVEKCSVVTGEIEELEKFPQYSRGADLTSYYLRFKIGDEEYYIDADVGVTVEYIDLWNEGDTITIYYQNINGKNSVIKAVKN